MRQNTYTMGFCLHGLVDQASTCLLSFLHRSAQKWKDKLDRQTAVQIDRSGAANATSLWQCLFGWLVSQPVSDFFLAPTKMPNTISGVRSCYQDWWAVNTTIKILIDHGAGRRGSSETARPAAVCRRQPGRRRTVAANRWRLIYTRIN